LGDKSTIPTEATKEQKRYMDQLGRQLFSTQDMLAVDYEMRIHRELFLLDGGLGAVPEEGPPFACGHSVA